MPLLELTDVYKCFGRFAAVAGAWSGLAATLPALGEELEWLVVRAEDGAGRSFTLEAAVPSGRAP